MQQEWNISNWNFKINLKIYEPRFLIVFTTVGMVILSWFSHQYCVCECGCATWRWGLYCPLCYVSKECFTVYTSIRCYGQVVRTAASYLGGRMLKSQPRNQLFWLTFHDFSWSLQMPVPWLLPHSFQFIIYQLSYHSEL